MLPATWQRWHSSLYPSRSWYQHGQWTRVSKRVVCTAPKAPQAMSNLATCSRSESASRGRWPESVARYEPLRQCSACQSHTATRRSLEVFLQATSLDSTSTPTSWPLRCTCQRAKNFKLQCCLIHTVLASNANKTRFEFLTRTGPDEMGIDPHPVAPAAFLREYH